MASKTDDSNTNVTPYYDLASWPTTGSTTPTHFTGYNTPYSMPQQGTITTCYCGSCGTTYMAGTLHQCVHNSKPLYTTSMPIAEMPPSLEFKEKMEALELKIDGMSAVLTLILDALGILSVPIDYP